MKHVTVFGVQFKVSKGSYSTHTNLWLWQRGLTAYIYDQLIPLLRGIDGKENPGEVRAQVNRVLETLSTHGPQPRKRPKYKWKKEST